MSADDMSDNELIVDVNVNDDDVSDEGIRRGDL